MKFNTAMRASILVSELADINKIHSNIIEQKKDITSDLILNCKNANGMSLSSVVIPADDAKRVLQMMEDYYANAADHKRYEIEQLT